MRFEQASHNLVVEWWSQILRTAPAYSFGQVPISIW